MPLALLILTLSAFAIGTTEFVILGLLPDVARSLSVDIPTAGWLVTGYALGVAIGGPIMALLTASLKRKHALILLMIIFIFGNVFCAIAANYNYLMIARVVTALCQASFFGIGAVVASSLVPETKKGQAVAMMFAGLTLANVLGVPLGTALGQYTSWRVPFWAIAILGSVTLLGLWRILPSGKDEEKVDFISEVKALKNAGIWIALLTTVVFDASMFAMFTYVAPMLEDVTKISAQNITMSLLLIGVGLTLGNYIGGRLADWKRGTALTGIALSLALVSAAVSLTMPSVLLVEINLFLWAVVAFASIPGLQLNVMSFGNEAPNLVATLNIGAFNIGNAIGAWIGGVVIAGGYGLQAIPLVAAAIAILAAVVVLISQRYSQRQRLSAFAAA
ncbi:MFS transporter [Pseudomonas edaphica]|uniref:MFS transporter n=1 Tax=Pseudomonas edaphica TaxID=2006980 RepID=UPI003D0A34FE